jgi:hypothetical protein
MSTSLPVPTGPVVAGPDAYAPTTDLSQVLTAEQVEQLKQNSLTSFNPVLSLFLSVITLGIFPGIYYGLDHGKLPRVKDSDPSAGKAIGFQFIPYFNIYWAFVVWPRLLDRINFQFRLRGKEAPLDRNFCILSIALCFILIGLLMVPIVIFQTQQAVNELAAERGA